MTPTNPQDGVELNCGTPYGVRRVTSRIAMVVSSRGALTNHHETETGDIGERVVPSTATHFGVHEFTVWPASAPAQPIADAGSTSATPPEPASDALEEGHILGPTVIEDSDEQGFVPVTVSVGGNVYIKQNDALIVMSRQPAMRLADAILATLRTTPSERAEEVIKQKIGELLIMAGSLPKGAQAFAYRKGVIDAYTLRTASKEPAGDAWRPIETAPEDGSQFLALVSNGWYALVSAPVEGLREGWPYQWWRSSDRQSYPVVKTHPEGYDSASSSSLLLTHWMPLPAALTARQAPDAGEG